MDVNSITGSIPNAFHTLVNLENLHLSHNKLSGTIPSFLGVFPDLETIDVSFNLLSGTLPTELATMDNLRGIAVDVSDTVFVSSCKNNCSACLPWEAQY